MSDINDKIKFIRACRKLGAKEVSFDGVQVIWDEKTTPPPNQPSIRQTKANEAKAEKIEDDSRVQENIDHADDQLSMTLIEDPLRYEELLREGDLEDAPRGEAFN